MENRQYSSHDIADIHFVYGFCNGSANRAVQEYRRRYPNRPTPSRQTFIEVHSRLAERGIQRSVNERARIITPEDEEEVLRLIANDPRLSVRRIAVQLQLSKSSVWRILKREGLHPFHFRRVQDIIGVDYASRSVFCSWLNRRTRHDPDFLKKILWTDEAKFTRAGITNHRNDHLWSSANPKAVRQSSFQHEFSVNVWAGIINDRLIGPLELPPTLNGARFLEFLETQFADSLLELPLAYRQQMWVQLDGAPAHYSLAVRNYLNTNHSPWIGRSGVVAWPPRSPDLTPLDYFLWGHMKQKVYAAVPNSREQLVEKIMAVGEEIRADFDMIRRASGQVAQRAVACLQAGGGHFEQLM